MKKATSIFLSFIFLLVMGCSKNNDDILDDDIQEDDPLEQPVLTVNDITINVQNIATPVNGQPKARFFKFNFLNESLYFQELTGNPENGASLWEYPLSGNEFILKEARGTNFSWLGWGTQLFNLGNMFHIDRTMEKEVIYYFPSADQWIQLETEVPNSIGFSSDVAVHNQTAYFLGGNFSSEFTSFNYSNLQWYNLAFFPKAIKKPLLITHEDYIYSISGQEDDGNSSPTDTMFARYSIANNSWETLPGLPFNTYSKIYGKEVAIVKNRYLVVSIYATDISSELYIYDLQTQKWKEESLPLDFLVNAIFQHQDELIMINLIYEPDIEMYWPKLYKATLQNQPQ